jgi:hypothetical protein
MDAEIRKNELTVLPMNLAPARVRRRCVADLAPSGDHGIVIVTRARVSPE